MLIIAGSTLTHNYKSPLPQDHKFSMRQCRITMQILKLMHYNNLSYLRLKSSLLIGWFSFNYSNVLIDIRHSQQPPLDIENIKWSAIWYFQCPMILCHMTFYSSTFYFFYAMAQNRSPDPSRVKRKLYHYTINAHNNHCARTLSNS